MSKDTMNSEGKLIYWDTEAQRFVSVPISNELLEELQISPTTEVNIEVQGCATSLSDASADKTTKVNAEAQECATSLSHASANKTAAVTCSTSVETAIKSEDSQLAASWKDEYAVKNLINLWKINEPLFKSSKIRNEMVWRQIATELQKTNPNWVYTSTQCENKFKDIRKNYVKIKDHNANSTGGEPKTCKFYEDMEEVLGDKPCIKPVAIASTLRKRPCSNLATCSDNPTLASTSEEDEIHEGAPSHKRNRVEKSLEKWAVSMRQDSQQKELEKERRHRERLEKQEQAIDTYRELMSKLLDKL